ncbi:MAG: V0D/AC39 family V-type ATPase subunit [Oscillospiraceae bacterium]|jgi:V/A-type H+-transporting ATPase subunit C
MLKSRMEYGAMSAKVLTLYGRLLKEEDWRRLCECRSVGDVYSFLRGHPGWSTAMAALPPSPTPQMLELTIDKALFTDFEKLYNFSSLADKEYFRFFIYKLEYEYLLSALVEKDAGGTLPRSAAITDFMRTHSSVDLEALAQAKSFSAVLAAAKGSIYEKPLSEMKPDPSTGMPSYWEAGILLENTYFKAMFSFLTKRYKGSGSAQLREMIGTEADLLNIISIIRLQRSFPASLERADELLIPVSYRLKPDFRHALENARSEAEAFEILKRSPFAASFENADPENLEALYYRTMERLCRKLVKPAEPDIGVPQAYLILRELECKKLMRLVETIGFGLDPKALV